MCDKGRHPKLQRRTTLTGSEDEIFLDPEGGSQNATLVVLLVVVVISSLKIPKAFLIRSGALRNFAYTFVLNYRQISQIFHLLSRLRLSRV